MLPRRGSSRRLRCYRARRARNEVRAGLDAQPLAHGPADWSGVDWRAVTETGQRMDALELLVDGAGQREGIEPLAVPAQLRDDLRAQVGAGEHPLEGRAGRIVAPAQTRADPLFARELHRGQEQVLEQPQLVGVERVHRRARRRRVIAHVPEELADVRPVLLFDVGVVVLLVGPAAGELDLLGLAVLPEMLVNELRAVVRVDAAQPEGQAGPELLERGLHGRLALAQHRRRLDPGGVDIGEVQRMHELAVPEATAMGDEVNLGEAGGGDIPPVGLHGDGMLEYAAGLGAAVERLGWPPPGPFSTRIACLRWWPVTAQNSSRIRCLSGRAASL